MFRVLAEHTQVEVMQRALTYLLYGRRVTAETQHKCCHQFKFILKTTFKNGILKTTAIRLKEIPLRRHNGRRHAGTLGGHA